MPDESRYHLQRSLVPNGRDKGFGQYFWRAFNVVGQVRSLLKSHEIFFKQLAAHLLEKDPEAVLKSLGLDFKTSNCEA